MKIVTVKRPENVKILNISSIMRLRDYSVEISGLRDYFYRITTTNKKRKKKPQKSKLQMHVKQNRDYGFYAAVRKPNDGGGGSLVSNFRAFSKSQNCNSCKN